MQDVPEIPPTLKRQHAQTYFLYSERFLNIKLFINSFFNKDSPNFPSLYCFHTNQERSYVLHSRIILKKFIVFWRKKRIFKVLIYLFPNVVCETIISFLV